MLFLASRSTFHLNLHEQTSQKNMLTRMHSSRMRTACSLTISWGACVVGGMCGRGACVVEGHAWWGGMCGGGCAWQGVCMAGGMHGMHTSPGQNGRYMSKQYLAANFVCGRQTFYELEQTRKPCGFLRESCHFEFHSVEGYVHCEQTANAVAKATSKLTILAKLFCSSFAEWSFALMLFITAVKNHTFS